MATKATKRHDWRVMGPVLKDVVALIRELQLPLVASSLAYTTILSIIPVLAVSFAVFHAFGGMDKLFEVVEPFIISNLAKGTGQEVTGHLRAFIGNAHANAVGAGGVVALLATTMTMLTSIETAINKIWGIHRQRSLFYRISSYWLIITLGPMALAVAVGLATSKDAPMTAYLPSGFGILMLTIAMLFLIYQTTPNTRVNWHYSLFSGILAGVAWSGAANAYEEYTKFAVSYSKIYGSLSAIPILLVWIYILWLIVLSGAALGACLQRRLEPPPAPAPEN
jgi:membrane protein